MWAKQKFWSACATQSDFHWSNFEQPRMQRFIHADNDEDSDQTARIRRLLYVLFWADMPEGVYSHGGPYEFLFFERWS